jgi:cytochrome c oxidase cbb3-type subunit III
MRAPVLMLSMPLAALCLCGCTQDPAANMALTGATAGVSTTVGPIPGPPVPRWQPRNPYAGDAAARNDGRELFVHFNCSGCHGGHAGGGMGPSLRDVDWIYGGEAADVFHSIAEGRAYGMPAWGTRLPQEQIWKLVAYIESLRTPDEPQPPG